MGVVMSWQNVETGRTTLLSFRKTESPIQKASKIGLPAAGMVAISGISPLL